MKRICLAMILILTITLAYGCAGPNASPDSAVGQPEASVIIGPPTAASPELEPPEATPEMEQLSPTAQPPENGDWSDAGVSLWWVLERMSDSGQPLTHFDAQIWSVEKTDSRLEYTLTIDEIELNDKFEDSSLNEEPPYLNEEIRKERIIVPYDAVVIVDNDIPMTVGVGDDFIRFTQESFNDDGEPVYIYRFYLCGDEVAFIHYIYMV